MMEIEIIDKPWGREVIWAKNNFYVGKILEIKKGNRLSLQFHERKTETMHLLYGKATLEIYVQKNKPPETISLKREFSIEIQPRIVHRLVALEDSKILEVSTPDLLDVIRLEDDYGRSGGITNQ